MPAAMAGGGAIVQINGAQYAALFTAANEADGAADIGRPRAKLNRFRSGQKLVNKRAFYD